MRASDEMLNNSKAKNTSLLQASEGSQMLSDHSSKEELTISKGSVPYRRSKASFTKILTYGMLLTCTVLKFIALSLHLGCQYATRNLERRCMDPVPMYCKYPVQLSMCQTSNAYALSTRITRDEPAAEVFPIQWDA